MDTQTFPTSRVTLPPQHTSFVGRETELAEITALLADPLCRLLTLVGPGGSGKTRLAIEVARQLDFADGVFVAPMQPLQSPDQVVGTIINVLNMPPDSELEQTQVLLEYLQAKRLLLVLDNFEHLMAAADLVAEMLYAAPQVKLLVTSREPLNLHEEWIREVRGLTYPSNGTISESPQYSALQLFAQRARRLQANFSLEGEIEHVVRICQLVDGLPLALELAAGWLRTLSCEAIVHEIEDNVDILASTTRNLPERHRSMRAVFAHSWQLLTDEERAVLPRFSVFRGGCDRDAAQQVTGATLPILASLVEKSLLRHVPDTDRYDMQELLRQYAYERLETSGETTIACDRHAAYFSRAIDDLNENRSQRSVSDILDAIGLEFENIRAAWRWALACDEYEVVDKLIEPIWGYSATRGYCLDAQDLYEAARDKLIDCHGDRERIILSRVLARLGKCYAGALKWAKSADTSRQALDIARSLDNLQETEAAMPWLAISLWNAGQHNGAREVMAAAIALARKNNDVDGLNLLRLSDFEGGTGHFVECQMLLDEVLTILRQTKEPDGWADLYFGTWALRAGKWDQAEAHFARSRHLFLAEGHHKGALWGYNRQGQTELATGHFEEAQQIAESAFQKAKSTEIMSMIGNQAEALCTLCLLAAADDDHAEARQLASEALKAAERLGDIFVVAPSKFALGWAILGQGDHDAASACFHDSLDKVLLWQATGQILYHVAACARILAQRGETVRAAELLGLIFTHPNSPQGYLERHQGMTQIRAELEAQLGPDTFAAAWERGATLDVEQVARDLLREFGGTDADPIAQANQSLPDPLTSRELDVLALLADGLTNPQIAERLFISTGTVKGHVNKILHKLDVPDRQQAVMQARSLHLLNL